MASTPKGVQLDRLIVSILYRDNPRALKAIETRYKRLHKNLKKIGKDLEGVGKQLVTGLKPASPQVKKIENRLNKLSKKATKTGKNLKGVGKSLVDGLKPVVPEVTRIEKRLDKLSASARTTRLAQLFRKTGLAVSGIGAALLAAVKVVSKASADYEHAMSRVAGLAGAAKWEMELFDKQIRSLSRYRGEGLTRLALALFPVRSAGHEGAAGLEILDEATKAARAGLGDAANIARIATRAIDQYGDAVSTAEVFDTLVFGVQRGNFQPEELITGLERMLQIAPSLGISLHEVTALMAGMSKAIGPERAAYQIESIMRVAYRPSEMALQVFSGKIPSRFIGDKEIERQVAEIKRSGFTHGDIVRSFREKGFLRTLKLMNELFGGTKSKLWGAMIEDSTALLGIQTLLGQTYHQIQGLVDAEGTTRGLRNIAYKYAMATLHEQQKTMINRLTAATESVGKHLQQPLKDLFFFVTRVANAFIDMNPVLHKFISRVLLAGFPIIALGGLLLGLTPIIKGLGIAISSWAVWGARFGLTMAVVKKAVIAVKAVLLSWPVLILGAVVGLVAGLYHNVESVRRALNMALPSWALKLIGGGKEAKDQYKAQGTAGAQNRINTIQGSIRKEFSDLWHKVTEDILEFEEPEESKVSKRTKGIRSRFGETLRVLGAINAINKKVKADYSDRLALNMQRLQLKVVSLKDSISSGLLTEDERIRAERELTVATKNLALVMTQAKKEELRQLVIQESAQRGEELLEHKTLRLQKALNTANYQAVPQLFEEMYGAARLLAQVLAEEHVPGYKTDAEAELIMERILGPEAYAIAKKLREEISYRGSFGKVTIPGLDKFDPRVIAAAMSRGDTDVAEALLAAIEGRSYERFNIPQLTTGGYTEFSRTDDNRLTVNIDILGYGRSESLVLADDLRRGIQEIVDSTDDGTNPPVN